MSVSSQKFIFQEACPSYAVLHGRKLALTQSSRWSYLTFILQYTQHQAPQTLDVSLEAHTTLGCVERWSWPIWL